MTIWHKRTLKVPVYYLWLITMMWAALWYADHRFARMDRTNQEGIHCTHIKPANALPSFDRPLRVSDL